jgi:hypothetical protein
MEIKRTVYEGKLKRGIDTSMHHLSVYSEYLVGPWVDLAK